jgi:hypothetical protein
MTLSRALSLAVFAAAVSIPAANAQFGGMPGCPPGMPRMMPGTGGGIMGCPDLGGPPLVCQQLLALRAEMQKNAAAISAVTDKARAQHKPPDPVETCKLFEVYLAGDSKFIQEMQNNAETCGVPVKVIGEALEGHRNALETGKQVCWAAEHAPLPSVPAFDPYFLEHGGK